MPDTPLERALGLDAFNPETPAVPTEGKTEALVALYGEPAFYGSNDFDAAGNAPFDVQFDCVMGKVREFIIDNNLDHLLRFIDIFTRDIIVKKFGHNYLFYNELKGIFESVYFLINHANTSQEQKLRIINEVVSNNLLVCGPGTVTRSSEALMNAINPRDINSLLARKRDQIITNIAERLFAKKGKAEGFNSHYALALRADAIRAGLNPAGGADLSVISDEYYYALDISDEDLIEFRRKFAKQYTAPVVIEAIAEFIRSETIDILHQHLDENMRMTAVTTEQRDAIKAAGELCLLGEGSSGLAFYAADYAPDPGKKDEYLVTYQVQSLAEVVESVLFFLFEQKPTEQPEIQREIDVLNNAMHAAQQAYTKAMDDLQAQSLQASESEQEGLQAAVKPLTDEIQRIGEQIQAKQNQLTALARNQKRYLNFLKLNVNASTSRPFSLYLVMGHPELTAIKQDSVFRKISPQEYMNILMDLPQSEILTAFEYLASNNSEHDIPLHANEFRCFFDRGVRNFDNLTITDVDFAQEGYVFKKQSFRNTEFRNCRVNLSQIAYLVDHGGVAYGQLVNLRLDARGEGASIRAFLQRPDLIRIAISTDHKQLFSITSNVTDVFKANYLSLAIQFNRTEITEFLMHGVRKIITGCPDPHAAITECIFQALLHKKNDIAEELLSTGYMLISDFKAENQTFLNTNQGITTMALIANAANVMKIAVEKFSTIVDLQEVEEVLSTNTYQVGQDPQEATKAVLLQINNPLHSSFPIEKLNEETFAAAVNFMLLRATSLENTKAIFDYVVNRLVGGTDIYYAATRRLLGVHYAELLATGSFSTIHLWMTQLPLDGLAYLFEALSSFDQSQLAELKRTHVITEHYHDTLLDEFRTRITAKIQQSSPSLSHQALVDNYLYYAIVKQNLDDIIFYLRLEKDLPTFLTKFGQPGPINAIYKAIIAKNDPVKGLEILQFLHFQARTHISLTDGIEPDMLTNLLGVFGYCDEVELENKVAHGVCDPDKVLTINQISLLNQDPTTHASLDQESAEDITFVCESRPDIQWLMKLLTVCATRGNWQFCLIALNALQPRLSELSPTDHQALIAILSGLKTSLGPDNATGQCQLYQFIKTNYLAIDYDDMEFIKSLIAQSQSGDFIIALCASPQLMKVFFDHFVEFCNFLLAKDKNELIELLSMRTLLSEYDNYVYDTTPNLDHLEAMLNLVHDLSTDEEAAVKLTGFMLRLFAMLEKFPDARQRLFESSLHQALTLNCFPMLSCIANKLPRDLTTYELILFSIVERFARRYQQSGFINGEPFNLWDIPYMVQMVERLSLVNTAAEMDNNNLYLLSCLVNFGGYEAHDIKQSIVDKLKTLTAPAPDNCPWLYSLKMALQADDWNLVSTLAHHIPADYLQSAQFDLSPFTAKKFRKLLDVGNVHLITQFLDNADAGVWGEYMHIYKTTMLHDTTKTYNAEIFARVIDFINKHPQLGAGLPYAATQCFIPTPPALICDSLLIEIHRVSSLEQRAKMFDYLFDHVDTLTLVSDLFANIYGANHPDYEDEISAFFDLLNPRRLMQADRGCLENFINDSIGGNNHHLMHRLSTIHEIIKYCAADPALHDELGVMLTIQTSYRAEEVVQVLKTAFSCSRTIASSIHLLSQALSRFPSYSKALDDFIDEEIQSSLDEAYQAIHAGDIVACRGILQNKIVALDAIAQQRKVPNTLTELYYKSSMRKSVLTYITTLAKTINNAQELALPMQLLKDINQLDFTQKVPSTKKIAKMFGRYSLFDQESINIVTKLIKLAPPPPKKLR